MLVAEGLQHTGGEALLAVGVGGVADLAFVGSELLVEEEGVIPFEVDHRVILVGLGERPAGRRR